MLQAAKVHHLCYSVDYKRGVLEILLNSKETLIMLLEFIHFVLCVLLHTYLKRSDGGAAD